MAKHAESKTRDGPKPELRVLDGQHRIACTERVLDAYDATSIVGLRIIVRNAAIERVCADGETTVELPDLRELLATAAVTRCLMPVRLRGWEVKAMRRILGMTLADLAKGLDERTALETVSRWESEAQPMGGFAEKVLRQFIVDELRKDAPGVDCNSSLISHMRVVDPWRVDSSYEVPHLNVVRVRMKEQSGSIIETWDAQAA